MAMPGMTEEALRRLLREALAEALRDERDLLRDVIQEVFEDLGLSRAIRAGEGTEPVSREEVFRVFEDSA